MNITPENEQKKSSADSVKSISNSSQWEKMLLKRSIEHFFTISSDALIIFDSSAIIKKVSSSFCTTFGYTEKELQGMNIWELIHPDDLERTRELKSAPDGIRDFENRYITKSGEVRNFLWNSIRFPGDGLSYAAGRDITDLRKKEEFISEQRMKMAAASRMNSLGKMASGLSHEINNPLAIISGNAFRLRTMLENNTLTLENAGLCLDRIDQMSQRIVAIIDSLRTFSRDASRDPIIEAKFSDIVDSTMVLCEEKLLSCGITMSVVGNVDFLFKCRPVQFSQILLNLINNSIDATENTERPWIKIEPIISENNLIINFIDSGKGLNKDQRENLFQPFFTTKPIGLGTGLGLSIVKGIVDAHGGKIYCDALRPNTTFIIDLPNCLV